MSEKTENKGESGESSDSEAASLSSANEQASDLSAAEVESTSDEQAQKSKGDSEVASTAGEDLSDSDSKEIAETTAESDTETAEVDAAAADTAESDSESTETATATADQPATEAAGSENSAADDKSADSAAKSESPKSSKSDSAVQNEESSAELKPKKISVPKRGTFSGRNEDVDRKWILIDADGVVVGRLASFIAHRLRGKHKPEFTPHVDDGDYVIVVNADKVVLTGKKYTDKKYYWHTGYPGGIKKRTAKAIMEGRFPERVLEKAVKRMLPSGPLAHRQYTNLRVYAGPDHPHTAQNPEIIEFGNMNPKNRLRA